MYSFTKANKKHLIAEDTKLWTIFILSISGLMIGFSLFLNIKAYMFQKEISTLTLKMVENNKQIATLKEKTIFIQKEKELNTQVIVNNELLMDGIKNLLDLIPDPITLTNIKIEKKSLHIYGITPTKEIYNILLLPPLKSIFTITKTNFYQMENSWYRFESINILKEEQ